jgi:dihydroneopterin triphosphate aldolase (PTPS-III) / 6-pyruvoyltetrahydropterin synthase
MTPRETTSFEVYVSKDTFKFHCAHFVAFQGFREKLHGHNYRVGVRVLGSRKISGDGYVVDFGDIKTVTKKVCKELNEHFLCPTLSDVMDIKIITKEEDGSEAVTLRCEDGAFFEFPKSDCAMLPILHATTEELAIYLWSRILEELNSDYLLKRGVHTMEITVAEAVGQEATFRLEIPKELNSAPLDVKSFIMEGNIAPMPCPSGPSKDAKGAQKKSKKEEHCGCNCSGCKSAFSEKLQQLADAINANKLPSSNNDGSLSVSDLEKVIGGL